VPALSRWFIRCALAYLALGFTLGATMLTLKALAHHGAMARLIAPHVEFLLMGWTLQLTMGVAFWILPRLEGGASRGAVGYAWLAFVLVNAGVIAAGLGPLIEGSETVRLLGRAAEAAAAIAFGLHAWRRVRRASVAGITASRM
jgi:hypothetical protein